MRNPGDRMTVAELIEELKKMPQDVDVRLWDDVDAEIQVKHIEQSEIVDECVMLIPY